MVWTIGDCCKRRFNCQPSPPEHPYLLYGTVLFGIVAIFWFLLKLLGNTEKYQSSQYVSGEIYAAFEIFFIPTQIFFLCLHGGGPISDHYYIIKRVFLMHIIATNCCLWFRITVGEASQRQNKVQNVCYETIFQTVCLPSASRNSSNSSSDSIMQVDTNQDNGFRCRSRQSSGRTSSTSRRTSLAQDSAPLLGAACTWVPRVSTPLLKAKQRGRMWTARCTCRCLSATAYAIALVGCDYF